MAELTYAKPPPHDLRRGAEASRMRLPAGRSRPFRIVAGTEADWEEAGEEDVLLVCPWLNGLEPTTGLWLAALPIHDCNGFIDSGWRLDAPETLRARCYVGVFGLDRLRSGQQIFGPLRDKGVTRLINLPSIGFFDGATAQTFDRLAFTLESEIAFLMLARSVGFGVALCAPAAVALAPAQTEPFDFVLRHREPGQPLFIEEA